MVDGSKNGESTANGERESEEERGDLIQFYNSVYVLKMKGFALKYATPTTDSRVCKSPHTTSEIY